MQTEKKVPKTSTGVNITQKLLKDPADKFMHFSAYLLECMVVPRPVEGLEGWNKRLDKWREFLVTPLDSACDCTPVGKTKRYACPHDLRLFEKKFPHPPVSDELFEEMTADLVQIRAIWMGMHTVIDQEEEEEKPQSAKDEKTNPDSDSTPTCVSCGHHNPSLSCNNCSKKFCSIICKMASCRTTDAKCKESRYAYVPAA